MNPDLKNGDVVWKKWDGFFWPCIYHTLDKLPGGDQLPTRYVAAVEYFGDNKYDYLTARTKIHPYNCADKHLFIKKGVQKQQRDENGDNYMNKFLQDVKLAEARTHGNVKILSLPEFQLTPQKKKCATSTLVKEVVSSEDSDAVSSSPLDKNKCGMKVDSPPADNKRREDKRRRVTISVVDEPETTCADNDAAAAAKRIKLHDVRNDDDSSDEDSLGVDVLNRSSGIRDKNFAVDQIVLVPYRKIYFPGFVTKVVKMKKKDIVYIRYVNGPRHERAFRKNAKCVLDFRDSERNSALRDAAARVEPSSAEAYDRCVQYLSIRSNRIKDLSAFRFLTRHPNDLHYGIIPDSELSISVKDLLLESEYSEEEEPYKFDEPETSGEDTESEEDITPTPPYISTLQLSQEEQVTTVREASKLLEVIKTDACLKHLQSVSNGKTTSWRHKMYHHGTKEERDELRGSSGLGVFYDEEQSYELLSFLRTNLPRIESVDKSRYMLNVWLPEAMLYALKEVHKVDQSEAEQLLRRTSCLSDYIEDLRK